MSFLAHIVQLSPSLKERNIKNLACQFANAHLKCKKPIEERAVRTRVVKITGYGCRLANLPHLKRGISVIVIVTIVVIVIIIITVTIMVIQHA